MRVLRNSVLMALAAALLCGCGAPVTQSVNDKHDTEIHDTKKHKTEKHDTKKHKTGNPDTLMRFEDGSPVFIRITKTQSPSDLNGVLEMFKRTGDGKFYPYKSWDICNYSGTLGPKLREGDGQSPEGFYFVKPTHMNPNSSYHLSFNLGFPNAYDRAHGRTGSFLMVHGDCVSIGCYAMTDAGIEDIYGEMEAAFAGGQPFIRVHIFPFPMTDANLDVFKDNPNLEFWQNLRQGWDRFTADQIPPTVKVENLKYIFDPTP